MRISGGYLERSAAIARPLSDRTSELSGYIGGQASAPPLLDAAQGQAGHLHIPFTPDDPNWLKAEAFLAQRARRTGHWWDDRVSDTKPGRLSWLAPDGLAGTQDRTRRLLERGRLERLACQGQTGGHRK